VRTLEDKHYENVTWTMRAEVTEYRESKANLGSVNSNVAHEAVLLDVQDYRL
jgi:hypothetical protein